jgi:small subunit ribosomal protein S20
MMPRVPANRSVRILRSPFQLETSLPNIKAAEKWVRQSEKRELRNRDVKTRLKTLFKKAKNSGDAATAPKVESQLDKAQKGIIHPNKAARKKSRLTKAIKVTAVAVAAAAAAPQTSRAARKKSGAKK